MKKVLSIFLAAALLLTGFTSLAETAGEQPATPTELTEQPEEPARDDTAEEPALKTLRVSPSEIYAGDVCTVTAELVNTEKVLLWVDGAVWPKSDTAGLSADELERVYAAAAVTVPESGSLAYRLETGLEEGNHTVALRLWNGTEWSKPAGSETLKVLPAEQREPEEQTAVPEEEQQPENAITLPEGSGSLMSRDTQTLAIDLNDVTKLTCPQAFTRVTVSSSKLLQVTQSGTKVLRLYPQKTGTCKMTVWWSAGGKTVYTVKISDKTLATSIELADSGTVDVLLDGVYKPSYTMYPSTATSAVTFSISNKKIASVDAATGKVTPIREGTVTLTVKTSNGKKDTVKLRIVDPTKVRSLTLNYSGTVSWPTDKALRLTYTAVTFGGSGYSPASGDLVWKSGSTRVATIDAKGNVTVLKAGTVTFTLSSTKSGKKASVKFKFVKTAPLQSITVSPSSLTLKQGSSGQLKAVLNPQNSELLVSLKWSSSDTSVATVDQNGRVTAVDEGVAVITVKDQNSGIYRSVYVKVSWPATYRAILCVEPTWVTSTINGYQCSGYYGRKTDLSSMQKVLSMQNFDGQKYHVTSLYSSTASKVLSTIDSVAGSSNVHDVTLFYFMGHGDKKGSLYFYDDTSITASQLKEHLDKIPGKVIVLLGACYSGTYITKDGGTEESAAAPSAFNSSIIRTFGQGDQVPETLMSSDGTITPVTRSMLDAADPEGLVPRSGELMSSKYYVLTCASAKQEGWSWFYYTYKSNYPSTLTFTVTESTSFNYFTRGVTRAGGYDGIDKTTMWKTGTRTLAQVYAEANSYTHTNADCSSDVQVYPKNSSFILFQH